MRNFVLSTLVLILVLLAFATSVPMPERRKIPIGVQTQSGQEKLITETLEKQLESIEPALRLQFEKFSNAVQYLRPISSKYILGKNGITLIVKYQVGPVEYFHAKVSPPTKKEENSDFKILGVSGPKTNYDPLLVF